MAVPGDKKKEAVGAKPVQAVSTHFIYKEARMMMALAGDDGEVAWFGGTVCHYDSNAKSWLIAYDDGDFKDLTDDEISTMTRNGELKPMAKGTGGLINNEKTTGMVEQIISCKFGRAPSIVAGTLIGKTPFNVADIPLYMSFHMNTGIP